MNLWDKFTSWVLPKAVTASKYPKYVPDLPLVRAAIHEAGHAVVASRCTIVTELTKIEINGGVGKVRYIALKSKDKPFCDSVIALAGIACECGTYGKFQTQAAAQDLVDAREAVARILEEHLPTPEWLSRSYEEKLPFADMFVPPLSGQEEALFHSAYAVAKRVLAENQAAHARLVGALLCTRSLEGKVLEEWFGHRGFACVLGLIRGEFI